MDKDTKEKKDITQEKVIGLLAETLGVSVDDIKLEDSLFEELHMTSGDIAELSQKIEDGGWEKPDFSDIETVEELIEKIKEEEI